MSFKEGSWAPMILPAVLTMRCRRKHSPVCMDGPQYWPLCSMRVCLHKGPSTLTSIQEFKRIMEPNWTCMTKFLFEEKSESHQGLDICI